MVLKIGKASPKRMQPQIKQTSLNTGFPECTVPRHKWVGTNREQEGTCKMGTVTAPVPPIHERPTSSPLFAQAAIFNQRHVPETKNYIGSRRRMPS
eukprot:460784-Pelagomonas_calceolata.AAC.6